jgi:hypothetical protein
MGMRGAIREQVPMVVFSGESIGRPGGTGHSPAQRQTVTCHRADCRTALRPAKLLCADIQALDVMA